VIDARQKETRSRARRVGHRGRRGSYWDEAGLQTGSRREQPRIPTQSSTQHDVSRYLYCISSQ